MVGLHNAALLYLGRVKSKIQVGEQPESAMFLALVLPVANMKAGEGVLLSYHEPWFRAKSENPTLCKRVRAILIIHRRTLHPTSPG